MRAERVHALLRRYAWNPTSFQILDDEYRLWFSQSAGTHQWGPSSERGSAAVSDLPEAGPTEASPSPLQGEGWGEGRISRATGVVAYIDTGRALVVAGAPICSPDSLADVTDRFVAAAARRGRAVAFFGVHERFLSRTQLPAIPIGEVMYWKPDDWEAVLARVPSLREQLRRAGAKGVRVERARLEQANGLGPHRPWLRTMRTRWLAGRGMAEMSFLAKLAPFRDELWQDRQLFVALRGTRPVGYLCLSPIYARRGCLVQELVRDDGAPNGTVELLLDSAFRWAAAERIGYLTLGLAPLAGKVPFWLRAAQACGRPLFDFEGLRAFKAKFRPQGSEVAALAGRGLSPAALMVESLRAFAGGSFTRFGLQTLRKRWVDAPRDAPEPSAPVRPEMQVIGDLGQASLAQQ